MKKGSSKLLRLAAGALAVLTCASMSGCGITSITADRDKVLGAKIVVIGQAKDIQFWDYVEQGATDAGKELGYTVEYYNANNTSDVDGQRTLIQNAIDTNAKAIVLAPNSATELNEVIRNAGDKGIPVLTIDADIDNANIRKAYIGTINASAGSIAARQAVTHLSENKVNGKFGKVGIITHSESSSAAGQRVGGFQGELTSRLRAMLGNKASGASANAGAPANTGAPGEDAGSGEGGAPQGGPPAGAGGDTDVIAGVMNCEGNADTAKDMATSMINSNPDLRVLYATNERSTIGVCEAVKAAKAEGKAENLMVIGYNSNTAEIEYIRTDILTGTMVQNPYNMGYLGVLYAGNVLTGDSVPAMIDTGVTYVHKTNLNNTEIQLLLDPVNAVE